LLIKVVEVFEAFQQTAYGIFMRQPVKQITYKYCINFAKTELPYRIQCISWHYRCVVNIVNYTAAVIFKML